MVSKTVLFSVSCPKQLAEFIETSKLSPSELFQTAIIQKKEVWDTFNSDKEIIQKKLKEEIERTTFLESYINEKGLENEWIEWYKNKLKNKQNIQYGNI